MTYESKTYAEPNVNGYKRLLSRTLTDWTQDGPLSGGYGAARRDPRVERSISISFEDGKALATMSETEYEDPEDANSTAPDDRRYFARLNPIERKSYHYLYLTESDGENLDIETIKSRFYNDGQLASKSKTEYQYDENYMIKGISSLPVRTKVFNPDDPNNLNAILADTKISYDENPLTGATSTTGYELPTGSHTEKRGKVTTQELWDDDNQIWIKSHTHYDHFGNGVKTVDHLGRQATVDFD